MLQEPPNSFHKVFLHLFQKILHFFIMPSFFSTALLALGILQASVVSASPASASPDLLGPVCYCANQALCTGANSQCTLDQLGLTLCCAPGQKGVSGKCVDPTAPVNLCTNGKTTCQGKTQCTQDNKGAIICCAPDQKAINGQCSDASSILCPDGKTICSGTTQCTQDNKGATICCPAGQKGINGKCNPVTTNLCSDGKTICSGNTPQCSIDVSIFVDSTGGASSGTICCANGEKALNGKCYPGNAKLQPCYQDGPCDWGKGYYCAWNAGNGDSKCCKLEEYYKGTQCIKKP
ncbi:hypothetical protein V8C35DRAFT_104067 [Trichoderma chlorosporum]